MSNRVLILAHRKELIEQAAEKVGLHSGLTIDIEMADQWADQRGLLKPKAPIVVASVQTLKNKRRLERFDPMEFGLLCIDEAHHATAASYRRIINHFKKNPNLKIFGVTATADRADEESLGSVFDACAYEMGICEGIDQGWLVPVRQQFVVIEGLDYSGVSDSAGDLSERMLQNVMLGRAADDDGLSADEIEAIKKQERMLHAVADPTIREAAGRPTLVFGPTKDYCRRLCEVFNRHEGVRAECILADTSGEERAKHVEDYKAGRIQVLLGCTTLTEGFDAPPTAVIAVARQTKSRSLYAQMVGRETRPLAGIVDGLETAAERKAAIAASAKPHGLVLDFVGNSGRHKLVSTVDILGGVTNSVSGERLKDEAVERARKRGAPVDMRELVEQVRQEQERKRREEQARRAAIKARAQYRTQEIDPFGGKAAPERVQEHYRGGSSDKQVQYLMRLGVSREKALGFTKRQAAAVIDEITRRTGANYVMRFGKHAGKPLSKVPASYLDWCLGNMERVEELRVNVERMRESQEATV